MDWEEIRRKVEALLAQMTPEEKVAQMIQIPYSHEGREASLRWAALGAGSFLHVLGDDAREIQQAALNSRMGIPVLFGIDAIHGHGLNQSATIFPSQLAQACSWNPDLSEEVGRVTAREVATDGLHWTFSPVLCLARDTRWGRVDETFGEDPYLAGEMGAGTVRGYQGESTDGPESILACAKHYFGYGEATGARDAYDSEITWRKAREVFLRPFERVIREGCATLMTAYGSIDGVPFTASEKALKQIPRDEMGFDGFIVTDWDNTTSLIHNQHVAADIEEASVLAANAGNDMIMTTPAFYEAALKALREGNLSESVIDDACRHILSVKIRMGLFEHPEKTGKPGCIGCPDHLESARRAARSSVTVVRNNGILPLGEEIRTVAVLGANADDIRAQYGDWTYFTHPKENPELKGRRPYVTLKEGLEQLAGKQRILYARGCGPTADPSDDPEAAVRMAAEADVIICAVGDNKSQHGEGLDRADLSLSGRQAELFRLAKATGKPVVTVLIASKPLCLGEAAENADATVIAFNGGMFGGEAIAEVLYGITEPEGRLPLSFPRHPGQIPVYYNHFDGWHFSGKYCDLPETPLFAFGEGLGYTGFRYDGLEMDPAALRASVRVTNTGSRRGTETVQFYFRDVVSSVMTPVKQLCGFCKVRLAPGETKTVTRDFFRDDFALILPDETRVTEPGEFILMAGHSSRDEDLLKISFIL